MTLQEREERYLMLLRRTTVGLARLLVVLIALALIGAAATFGYSFLVHSKSFEIPAKALIQDSDPAKRLAGGGSDPAMLTASAPTRSTNYALPTYSLQQAKDEWTSEVFGLVKDLGRSYNDEAAARTSIANGAAALVNQAGEGLGESIYDERSRSLVANAAVAYMKDLRQIVRSHKDKFAPPIVGEAEDVNASVRNLLDATWLGERLRSTVHDAHAAYEAKQAQASLARYAAFVLLSTAGSLFVTLMLLLFVFVFIKIEIDLRDIRDRVGNATSAVPVKNEAVAG